MNNIIQCLVYTFLVYVFTHRILIGYGILPNSAKWLVELFSVFFIPVILLKFAIGKEFYGRQSYFFIFSMLLVVVIIGAVISQSSASSIILGVRHHFKFIPFFLLPIVHKFSESDIKKILLLILCLLFMQVPVTLIQRFVMFSHLVTGDVVGGTINGSGSLSVILVSTISVLYSLYLKKSISFKKLIIVSMFLFIPTTINETKVTFLLLPFGLAIPTLLLSEGNLFVKFRKIVIYFIVVIVFIFSFVTIYNVLYGKKVHKRTFYEYLVQEKEGRGYLFYGGGEASERIERGYRIGRFDSISIAVKMVSKNIGHLMFGIGVGNAVATKMDFFDSSDDNITNYLPDMTTISNIIWEMGLLGLGLHLCLLIFVFIDAYTMRQHSSFLGSFCIGWCSVVGIMILTLAYMNVLYADSVNISFWLLSGIVVSIKKRFHPTIERV